MLVNGTWQEDWQPVQNKDEDGRFVRQTSSFRHQIGDPDFPPEAGRYHLYVAYICPWASRTLMARTLKGLEDVISVTVVNPQLTDQGWRFGGYDGTEPDPFNDTTYMHEIYSRADPEFTGRATVPVLWDKKHRTIVNNESADIVRMLNHAFDEVTVGSKVPTAGTPDLYPEHLRNDIDTLNADIYENLNNGVYKAGFATTQLAYEEAYYQVFTTLDQLEDRFSDGRTYLFGNEFTEADIRLFVTLIRFDLAYHGLFKCNRNMLKDMPGLHAYMRRVLDLKGIKNTVFPDHIKAGYYSVKALNPTGIVPLGPLDL